MKAIIGIFLSVFALVFLCFTISSVWGWFIVPAFGLPAITAVHAYGILLVFGLLSSSMVILIAVQSHQGYKDLDNDGQLIARSVMTFLIAGLGLVIGKLVEVLFM